MPLGSSPSCSSLPRRRAVVCEQAADISACWWRTDAGAPLLPPGGQVKAVFQVVNKRSACSPLRHIGSPSARCPGRTWRVLHSADPALYAEASWASLLVRVTY